MLGLKREYVEGYIEYQPTDMSNLRILWSCYFFFTMVAIPTALFGVYSQITKQILLPLTVILGIWAIYLSIGLEHKKMKFTLFHGSIGLFISVVCLLAAYKILMPIVSVSMWTVISTFVIYVIAVVLNIMNVIRLIKKGYYQTQKKQVGATRIAFVAGLVGLGIGKIMVGKIGQNAAVFIIASLLIIISLGALIGTQNFLKYYLMKSLNK